MYKRGVKINLMPMEEVTIERLPTTEPVFVDGYEVPPETLTFVVKANVQPAYGASDYSSFGSSRKMESSGDRMVEGFILFSNRRLEVKDKVFRGNGEVYLVRVAQDWTTFIGLNAINYRAFITKCEDGI
jgi:hypothetical protein